MSEDIEFDRRLLRQLEERLEAPGIGVKAFASLSNERRQVIKRMRAVEGEVSVPAVSVEDARVAFSARFGEVDSEAFQGIYERAVESCGWPVSWWERFGDRPVAMLMLKRAARETA
ncbi:hypothetical protein TPB0596_33760 [Tsukamurella pulmonis]|uniref:hypothetical protein n=1 Tax=Tsukamurella pulmonis TaxID=47312 RepID=UPI001EDDE37F|nr:hypothetical protein [Tsukamurella pulmonis]BDD83613.1 hypothetical protein TPB0596_33760 [Tsukamurella pulmonis]